MYSNKYTTMMVYSILIKRIRTTILLLTIMFTSSSRADVLDDAPLIETYRPLPELLYNLVHSNLDKYNFTKNLTTDPVWGSPNCQFCNTDLPKLKASKVATVFWTASTPCLTQYKDSVAATLEQIDVIKRFIKKYPRYLQFATSPKDILEAFEKKKIASLIGVCGGQSIDSRLSVLRMFYELGARYMTFVDGCNTPWAEGAFWAKEGTSFFGLTSFGKLVVKEMNRLGMLIDLSHATSKAAEEVIRISEAPVILAHDSSFSVSNLSFNVQDSILGNLRGGIIMLEYIPWFAFSAVKPVSSEDLLNDVAKHINHLATVAGIRNVGIGLDFNTFRSFIKGLEGVSTYPDLFNHLKKQNASRWNDDSLKLLAGENFLRVFREAERVRDTLSVNSPVEDWISEEELDEANDNQNVWTCRTLEHE